MRWLCGLKKGDAMPRGGEQAWEGMPVGITGASWGGAMAACVAVVSRRPVACVPCLGSDSARVMSSGIISWQIDWAALKREKGEGQQEAVARIEEILD